jgi:WD repeat and SOF domain-containing protein 1
MSSASGRSSPLPSFASPRDVSSVSLFAALTALAHPADSTTVEEKNDALSNRPRGRSISGREWWITRRFWDIFTPLVIVGGSPGHHGRNGSHPPATLTVPVNTIPRGGGTSGKSSSLSGNKLGRSLTIPVLKILHPARDQGRSLHRRDGRTNHAYGTVYSTRRVVIAIVGTGLSFLVVFLCFFALFRPLLPSRRSLPFSGDPSTCILSQDEIQRVWLWEIASGRYPSRRKPAVDLRQHAGKKSVFSHNVLGGVQPLGPVIENPGLPKKSELEERTEALAKKEEALKLVEANAALTRTGSPSLLSIPTVVSSPAAEPDLIPIGPPRSYLSILPKSAYHASSTSIPPSPFAPRPQPYSVLDLDAVMEHCDFSEGRYVRDCLEVLRMNAGMDSGVRRGNPNKTWKLNFLQGHSERLEKSEGSERNRLEVLNAQADMTSLMNSTSFAGYLAARQQLTIDLTISPQTAPTDTSGSTIDSASPVSSSKRRQYTPHPTHPTADPGCDPDYPRIFHIFWAGPFTDKPYSAAMSFLYTQRLGLEKPIGSRAASTTSSSGHLDIDEEDTAVEQICRPQLWIWINPGPASSRPDPLARLTMMKGLAENPWSKPLLHTRFQESIKFKLWNTTEQLDSVTEMEGWREMRLFNSGGVKYGDVTEVKHSVATNQMPFTDSPFLHIIEICDFRRTHSDINCDSIT